MHRPMWEKGSKLSMVEQMLSRHERAAEDTSAELDQNSTCPVTLPVP